MFKVQVILNAVWCRMQKIWLFIYIYFILLSCWSSLCPLLVRTWCPIVSFQINQTKLPLRPVDSRVLTRGPDFTPAFADFSRQLLGGRGAPVSDASTLISSTHSFSSWARDVCHKKYSAQSVNKSTFPPSLVVSSLVCLHGGHNLARSSWMSLWMIMCSCKRLRMLGNLVWREKHTQRTWKHKKHR